MDTFRERREKHHRHQNNYRVTGSKNEAVKSERAVSECIGNRSMESLDAGAHS